MKNSPNIIFGLAELPKPKTMGYFYCKPPSKYGDFNMKILAVLDLYITDTPYLTKILTKGIATMLKQEKYSIKMQYYLENYKTENMEVFVQAILQEVVDTRLNKSP